MLNESRYETLKETFKELKIQMPEEQIREYTKIIDYIAYVTEDKFTEMEMVAIYGVLGDIVEGKEPQMALIAKSDDIIPTLVRILEELPLTKGKLTMEQKLRIAFCERAITGVHEQPEGVVFDWYDTIECAEKQFNFFRETMPSWFNVSEAPRINRAKYGLSVDEPIQTTSVRASYMYLNRLRYNGKPIIYERVGSCGGKNGNIVDRYRVFQEKGLLFKKKVFICDLYIDAYSTKQPNLAPSGFTL